jgi:sn-glycerol 3-phosphate transport system substrate-binding protein
MPDIRKDVENALQAAVLQGQDVQQALGTATDTANKQIADYNSKLGS